MEDGCVLATALASLPDDPHGALKLYERARLPRASRVVLTARAGGEDNNLVSTWAALKRDALIAIRRRFGSDPTGRPALAHCRTGHGRTVAANPSRPWARSSHTPVRRARAPRSLRGFRLLP